MNKDTKTTIIVVVATLISSLIALVMVIAVFPPDNQSDYQASDTTDYSHMKEPEPDNTATAESDTTSPETEDSAPTINTLDDGSATAMVEELDSNWKGVTATVTAETGFVLVEFEAEFWDENDAVFKTNSAAAKIMPDFFEIEGVKSVNVQMNAEFTDQYGKSEKSKAVGIELTKETADKVDFENILTTNRAGLLNIADHKYIHPGTLKSIDNEDILAAYQQ